MLSVRDRENILDFSLEKAVQLWAVSDSCVGGGCREGQTSLVKRQLTEQQHNIMLPKNYSLRKILVLFSFFEIYCTRVGNSERFSQGKPRVFVKKLTLKTGRTKREKPRDFFGVCKLIITEKPMPRGLVFLEAVRRCTKSLLLKVFFSLLTM